LYLYGRSKLLPYKSSFQVIRSSKYTQEFSLAVNSIFSKLKQSINCPRCFCSSLRYSIYKVQHSLSSGPQGPFIRQLAYDTTSFLICQYLFSNFFKNFCRCLFCSVFPDDSWFFLHLLEILLVISVSASAAS